MENYYREEILKTYHFLLTTHEELFTRILNVGMNGEYKEINQTFTLGDTFDFEIDQFKGTNDTNLDKLIELFEQLEETMNSFANLNDIKEEELEIFNDEDEDDDEEPDDKF